MRPDQRENDALANMMGAESSRIDRLSGEVGKLGGVVQGLDGKVDDVRTGINKLADAMSSVVRLEVQHQAYRDEVAALRIVVAKLDVRVQAIEGPMPGLIESRAWTVRAVLAVASMVVMALVALVIRR